MAKKTSKIIIACPYYKGELALMPTEAKDKMKEKDPNLFKQIFETK